MELAKLLQIQPGVTALIGSGGKTSTMLALADELGRTARVIVCTTTRILPPEGLPLLMQADAARAPEVLSAHGVVCIGQAAEKGKLGGLLCAAHAVGGLCARGGGRLEAPAGQGTRTV